MNRNSINRNGSIIVELLACGALLGIILTTVIPTLRWIVRQRKLATERQAALIEVENLRERLSALEWSELTDRAAEFRLSAPVAEQLSDSKLQITVAADADDDAAKIVNINLSWQLAPDRPAPPVRLTTWVYRTKSRDPPKEDAAPN